MFGMLDYRAHKLYWLFFLPFYLLAIMLSAIVALVSATAAFFYFEHFFVRLFMAIVFFEIASLVLQLVFAVFLNLWRRLFFFFVDLEPAEGRSPDEAQEVLVNGEIPRTLYRLKHQPSEFSRQDQAELVSRFQKSQGLIVRVLRPIFGVTPNFIFSATASERIAEIVAAAKANGGLDAHNIVSEFGIQNLLFEAKLQAGELEKFLAEKRHLIYKYCFLLIVFLALETGNLTI